MPESSTLLNRRTFTAALSAAAIGSQLVAQDKPAEKPKIKLGIDNFAVRAMGWKAPALIDYAETLRVDSVFITDLDAFEKLDDAKYLADLKSRAADKGLQIQVGTWSICPDSSRHLEHLPELKYLQEELGECGRASAAIDRGCQRRWLTRDPRCAGQRTGPSLARRH
jgi:hypothetical protein